MNKKNPVVTIQMRDGGKMVLELYPDKAPVSVANFVDLIQKGFYNGLTFHRVVQGFVIQAGSRNGNCAGEDLGFAIKGEFKTNGVDTGLGHPRGAISMARTMAPDSASTQFFICHAAASNLDGQYAAFGQMTDGFDVLDRIASIPVDPYEDKPHEPQVMETVTVELNDYSGEPERIGKLVL